MKPLIVVGLILASQLVACQSTGLQPWKYPCEEYPMPETEITREYAEAVADKHWRFLIDHPDVNGFNVHNLVDEDGKETNQIGIILSAGERSDQSEIPEEQRIGDCLDGVPVQWETGIYPRLTKG